MGELLSKLGGGQLLVLVAEMIVLVAVFGGLLTGIIAVLATQWRRVRVTEAETALKQQLLEKGMSAAEIEQVLKASSHPRRSGGCSPRRFHRHPQLGQPQSPPLDDCL